METEAAWDRVKNLVADALECEPADRAARLDVACGHDAALRARVEALLALEDQASAFLETAAELQLPPDTPDPPVPPVQVGRYRIIRRLAVGGAGTVYEAQQEQPRRTVALKLLRPEAHASALAQRFALESEVLAHLHHPGIAHVYEAGVHEQGPLDIPWIAMELVHGARTLTGYVQEKDLPAEPRVELFITVCKAVQHGHDRGIVHRDLKPANVLVDETGHPKVIDFGVARVLAGARVRDLSVRTAAGDIIGTLPYMSPEQCSGDPDDVDARADVYALGVLLFEMLTGRLPLVLAGLPLEQAIQTIRQTPPARLRRVAPSLGADLDAITARALDKVPTRRYDSAAALAADCRRWLDREPVLARPPSLLYQARCFTRRHRVAVAATAIVAAALVTASIVSTVFAVREGRQRRTAERVTSHLETMLTLPDPHRRGADTTVLEMLDLLVQRLDAAADEPPAVEAAVRHRAGSTYLQLGRFEQAEQQYRRAVELYDAIDPRGAETAIALNSLGIVLHEQGRPAEAEPLYRRALAIHRARPGDERPSTLTVLSNLSTVIMDQGKVAEAVAILREVVDERRRDPDVDPVALVSDLRHLARLHRDLGEPVLAEATLDEAIDAIRAGVVPTHPIYAAVLGDLGEVRRDRGDLDGSRAAFAEAWTWADGTRTAGSFDWNVTLRRYIDSLLAAGDVRTARAVLAAAVDKLAAEAGPDDRRTAEARAWLASIGNK